MYREFKQIELQEHTFNYSSTGQASCRVTQLFADGLTLLNAIERIEYEHAGFQALVCDHCGIPGCEPGSWICLRVTRDSVLIVPAVAKLRDDVELAHEFKPPHYLARHAVPALRTDQFAQLATIESDLPSLHDLKGLSGLEALAVHQVSAPGGILGPVEEQAQINYGCIFATTDGDLNDDLRHLQMILDQAEAGEVVRVIEAPDRIVEFHLDLPNYPSWYCLAFEDGEPGFYIGPVSDLA